MPHLIYEFNSSPIFGKFFAIISVDRFIVSFVLSSEFSLIPINLRLLFFASSNSYYIHFSLSIVFSKVFLSNLLLTNTCLIVLILCPHIDHFCCQYFEQNNLNFFCLVSFHVIFAKLVNCVLLRLPQLAFH